MKFIDVDPSEIDNIRDSRRGRVSYPMLKSFLETGKFLVMLDLTGVQQSKQSLSSSLTAYIRSHNLPIKMFQRRGNMYLMRLDIDDKGNQIPDWQENQIKDILARNVEEQSLTGDLVEEMLPTEINKVTK